LIINSSEYTTRTYIPGDETTLVLLFNAEHANLAGFVPRTIEYWSWCCLKRPDIEKKGILIVEKEGKTVGYAVVGKSGNVWELCYDSSCDAKTVVSKLLTQAVDYVLTVGSNSAVLNANIEDSVVREVCRDMNFAESPPEPVFFSVVDLPQLMCEILQAKNLSTNIDEEFWFNLKNCPSWCVPSFGVRIKKSKVSVFEEPDNVPRTTIETEMSILVALIFGTGSLLKYIMSSKMHFSPFWKISKVQMLFNLLQTKKPWFIPRADIG
jgi:hypothetical protein